MTAAPPWIYVATAQAFDAEMEQRIGDHRGRRDSRWTTVEAPLDLVEAAKAHGAKGKAVLVDCLTLWLSNLMAAGRDMASESGRLVDALAVLDGPIVVVSNEVGLGVVPDNALARDFRDAQGLLNQRVAATASRVVFVAAGLPLTLK